MESGIIENGFDKNFPIMEWHGFIVDGHNRYKMCQELGIYIDLEKNVVEIELGDFAEEIDAMDWMLTHQLSSKNLTPGEKLAMMDEFKEEVKLENEKKKLSTLKQNQTSDRSLQLEASDKNNHDRSLHTDRQIAQKAGVGVGTVARYNKVMILLCIIRQSSPNEEMIVFRIRQK